MNTPDTGSAMLNTPEAPHRKIENPPAFPVPMSQQTSSNQDCAPFQQDMSLRDYFAAAALQGLLANPIFAEIKTAKELVPVAVDVADTLLAALAERAKQ